MDAAPCAKVLAQLPVALGRLQPRVVHTTPDTPFVVAWGDPAVVVKCGVDRPTSLKPGSDVRVFSATGASGPYFDVTRGGDSANVYTTVDRAAYVSVTIPGAYNSGPLPALSRAIAKALPTAVCSTDPATPNVNDLCTRRK